MSDNHRNKRLRRLSTEEDTSGSDSWMKQRVGIHVRSNKASNIPPTRPKRQATLISHPVLDPSDSDDRPLRIRQTTSAHVRKTGTRRVAAQRKPIVEADTDAEDEDEDQDQDNNEDGDEEEDDAEGDSDQVIPNANDDVEQVQKPPSARPTHFAPSKSQRFGHSTTFDTSQMPAEDSDEDLTSLESLMSNDDADEELSGDDDQDQVEAEDVVAKATKDPGIIFDEDEEDEELGLEEDEEEEDDDEEVDDDDDNEEEKEEEEEEEDEEEEGEKKADADELSDDSGSVDSQENSLDISRQTRRQRADEQEGLIALSNEAQKKKKHHTKEEVAMKKAELARRRKNLTEIRQGEAMQETIKRLLYKQDSKQKNKELKPDEYTMDENGNYPKPAASFIRYISSATGTTLLVSHEWIGAPAGELFQNTLKNGPVPFTGRLVEEIDFKT